MDELKLLSLGHQGAWRSASGQPNAPQAGPAAPANTGRTASPVLPDAGPGSELEQQLRWLLPRRDSVSQAMATLLDPAQRVNILSLSGMSQSDLERLQGSVHSLQSLAVAARLKQAVALSGLFAQADVRRLLGASAQADSVDMKSLLLALLARVEAGRGDGAADSAQMSRLRAQLEGALATIALNQLSASGVRQLPGSGSSDAMGASWLMAIPLRVGQSITDLGLSIERREGEAPGFRGESARRDSWRVHIQVSLPWLGPLEAELLLDGRRLSVVLYAQLERSASLLESRVSLLHWALQRCGLEVATLNCRHGSMGTVESRWQPGVDCTV